MVVINLFSASHCHGDEIASAVTERLGLTPLTTEELVARASQRYQMGEAKLLRAMQGPRSFFYRWNREKERAVAHLRATLAELLERDEQLYHGFAGHLMPASLEHVLRVCLVARPDHRASIAAQAEGLSESAARDLVHKEDQARYEWVGYLKDCSPWEPELYDIFLPMDDTAVEEAVDLICESARKAIFAMTASAHQAIEDFVLSSRVGVVLAENGHNVDVAADRGELTITIDHYVMRLERLKQELTKLAKTVPGVISVQTKIGPNFQQPDIYIPKVEAPKKILLVDDERDFVRVLSERLEARDLGASMAHDGEQALAMIESDTPEVMVLDLRMPGIDGLEVLRKVKRGHPDIEVIILTGHGSEQDRDLAMSLGAFAYLQKPADIDVLTDTMKRAYEKIRIREEQRRTEAGETSDS